MAKYLIPIPPASAKRLEADRRLEIIAYGGSERSTWEFPIPCGDQEYYLDFEEIQQEQDINWIALGIMWDGYERPVQYVYKIVYRNVTGSRKEEIKINPKQYEIQE